MRLDTSYISSLVLEGSDGTTYDVVGCQLTRTLNQIPTAQIILGLGYNIKSRRVQRLRDSTGDPKTIWTLVLDGSVSRELITGYIVSLAKDTTMASSGSQARVKIQLTAEAGRLPGMSAQGHVFWPEGTKLPTATSLADEELKEIVFQTPFANVSKALDNILFPENDIGKGMVDVLGYIYENWTGIKGSAETIQGYFQLPSVVQLQQVYVPGSRERILEMLLTKTFRKWHSSNIWDTLRAYCRGQFFLNIVPSGTSFDIIPAFPWKKEPEQVISGADVLRAADTTSTGALVQEIDAVFVSLPDGNNMAQWPLDAGEDALSGAARVISIPEWLEDSLEADYISDKDLSRQRRILVDRDVLEQRQQQITASNQSVAEALAKTFFSEAKNASAQMSLRLHWSRLELMDLLGYVIKVDNLSNQITGDKGAVYGMVSSVQFGASSSQNGSSAQLNLVISHLRDDALNEEYGLDQHPIYTVSNRS